MSRPVEITLLTQNSCTFCEDAKQVLNRLGREFAIRVREIDLAGDEGRRLALAGGLLFAPGVLVDGRSFSYGRLSERKLRRTLIQSQTQLRDRVQ